MAQSYEMFVIAFDTENRAREARAALQQLEHEHQLDLKESSVITREADGTVLFDDTSDLNLTLPSALANATRLLVNILAVPLGLPEMSAPVADRSAVSGIIHDFGFKSGWLDELGSQLKPGSSALVALVKMEQAETCRKLASELTGGHLLEHSLSAEHYQQLNAALQ